MTVRPGRRIEDREILLEIQTLGKASRIAAVDALTGEEVVFQAPVTASRGEIEHLAMALLARRMGLTHGDMDYGDPKEKRPGEGPGRGFKV